MEHCGLAVLEPAVRRTGELSGGQTYASVVLGELRDAGPIVLVPSAWAAAGAAEFGYLSPDGILVAHLVMAGFITFFTVTGWNAMASGALRAWRLVLVVGLGITLAGVAGFLVSNYQEPLRAVSLIGWMILPAVGLMYTGRELDAAPLVYFGGGALSLAGAGAFVMSLGSLGEIAAAVGIALVGIGQTVGIVDASQRD